MPKPLNDLEKHVGLFLQQPRQVSKVDFLHSPIVANASVLEKPSNFQAVSNGSAEARLGPASPGFSESESDDDFGLAIEPPESRPAHRPPPTTHPSQPIETHLPTTIDGTSASRDSSQSKNVRSTQPTQPTQLSPATARPNPSQRSTGTQPEQRELLGSNDHNELAKTHQISRQPSKNSQGSQSSQKTVRSVDAIDLTGASPTGKKSTEVITIGSSPPDSPVHADKSRSPTQEAQEVELVEQPARETSTGTRTLELPAAPPPVETVNEADVFEPSSAISGIPETDQRPVPEQMPRIKYTQSQQPHMAQTTIGPLLTEKIGLLERKVEYLESLLRQNHIEVNTAHLDKGISRVMKLIDEFNDDDDNDDEFFVASQAICSSPPFSQYTYDNRMAPIEPREPMEQSGTNRAYQKETQIDSGDEDADNFTDESPYFTGKRGFEDVDEDSEFDDHIEMVMEVARPQEAVSKRILSQKQETQPEQPTFSWTSDVMHTLRNKFGLSGFRANQLEAINETLAGKDVVVLMPTGGGKSLCYQLPALISSGKSRGTTVVISPLISLMQDQVYHLKNRNIAADMINSQLSFTDRSEAFQRLSAGQLQLVYLSPEMLSASNQMNRVLADLYDRNLLARLVIDEAHCVSQWGHDFRPDYRLLERLKMSYARTPIMALTATANDRVLLDIVNCVRHDSLVLKQSFNRPNLSYEVVPKRSRGIMADVASICNRHAGRSGIIYCHSRTACEETAESLRKQGVDALHYHAGMSVEERQDTQSRWQEGNGCSVVCATIAFGMGIDKSDVRFVIHMTLPRNMEGYYQETGRAGRDGRRSWCTLFYNYGDANMMMGLISRDDNLTPQDRENHRNLLTCVVQYCENSTDCRRRQILQYFSESFDPADCHETCDNCRNMVGKQAVKIDMTEQSKLAVALVQQIFSTKVTILQCIDIMKGSKSRRVVDKGHHHLPMYGQLSSMDRTDLERLFHQLVAERVLEEYSTFNMARYPQTYVRPGPLAEDTFLGQRPVFLVSTSGAPAPKRRATAATNGNAPHPPQAQGSSQASPGGAGQSRRTSYANRGRGRRGGRARGGGRGRGRSSGSTSNGRPGYVHMMR